MQPSWIYRKPQDVVSYIGSYSEFLGDFKIKKYVYEKVLSLASNNAEITEVQKKIQELYAASL